MSDTPTHTCFSCALFTHMAGYGPVVGWEGDLVGVDNVMGLVFFRTNPPERGYATSLPICEVMPIEDRTKTTPIATTVP